MVGLLDRLVIVLGSSLRLQTWGMYLGHMSPLSSTCTRLYRPHASRCMSRSVKALIPSSYKALRRREGQLLTCPTWEVETALRSEAKPVGVGPYHVFHSPWHTHTSVCSLSLSR